jgi:hypothetical protein
MTDFLKWLERSDNMLQMKMGGLVLTGIGAYLIISKGIGLIDRTVCKITEAQKWKAYYKACAENRDGMNKILPPHYEQTYTYPSGEKENIKPEGCDPEKEAKKEASQEALKGTIKNVIDKAVDTIFEARKDAKNSLESPENRPYYIDQETFEKECPEYEKCRLEWYVNDDVLAKSAPGRAFVVLEPEKLLGTNDLRYLFHESPNPNSKVCYVRNDENLTDYEVTKVHDKHISPIDLAVTTAPETQDKNENN